MEKLHVAPGWVNNLTWSDNSITVNISDASLWFWRENRGSVCMQAQVPFPWFILSHKVHMYRSASFDLVKTCAMDHLWKSSKAFHSVQRIGAQHLTRSNVAPPICLPWAQLCTTEKPSHIYSGQWRMQAQGLTAQHLTLSWSTVLAQAWYIYIYLYIYIGARWLFK